MVFIQESPFTAKLNGKNILKYFRKTYIKPLNALSIFVRMLKMFLLNLITSSPLHHITENMLLQVPYSADHVHKSLVLEQVISTRRGGLYGISTCSAEIL